MEHVGIAKTGFDRENHPVIDSLLSAAPLVATALLARAPSPDEIWGRVFQIIGTTIFSVIIIWVVIKVWNGEFLAGDSDEEKDDEKKG